MDLREYRQSPKEKERIENLMKLVPKGHSTILDIGARDGYLSRLLTQYCDNVTALDLEKPNLNIPNVMPVKGDITDLDFPDNYFDVIFCTEVLEHIPPEKLSRACKEIERVAKHEVVIGVPYNQDLRVGQTTCGNCGNLNPPWGHVNSFNELKLRDLFKMLTPVTTSYAGETKDKTNRLSSYLMNLADNPWGTYEQEEPCIHCREKIIPIVTNKISQQLCSKIAFYLTKIQNKFISPSPEWIHMVFMKKHLSNLILDFQMAIGENK